MLAKLTIPTDPADRFACIIEVLCRAVAARIGRGLEGPLIILICTRLRRIAARFAALAARVRAGRLTARSAAGRRPGRAGSPRDPAKRLPEGFAWLVRLVPGVAAGSQLQHLLNDPQMAALIAASPQAGRILRPLCRMLGVEPMPGPLALPPRPRTKRAEAEPAASADPADPATPTVAPSAVRHPIRPPRRRYSVPGWVPRHRMPDWSSPKPG